jgi:hypothetical protein
VAARAQQPGGVRRIGVLMAHAEDEAEFNAYVGAFRDSKSSDGAKASISTSISVGAAVYPWRFFPGIGGLLSYECDQRELFRLAATYVDRILRGTKPSELPV